MQKQVIESASQALARRTLIQSLPLNLLAKPSEVAGEHVGAVTELGKGFPQTIGAFSVNLRDQQAAMANDVRSLWDSPAMRLAAQQIEIKCGAVEVQAKSPSERSR